MTAYLIVDTKIIDQKAYEDYKIRAKPIVEHHGGEYLARGGNTTVLENELWTPTRLVVVSTLLLRLSETITQKRR